MNSEGALKKKCGLGLKALRPFEGKKKRGKNRCTFSPFRARRCTRRVSSPRNIARRTKREDEKNVALERREIFAILEEIGSAGSVASSGPRDGSGLASVPYETVVNSARSRDLRRHNWYDSRCVVIARMRDKIKRHRRYLIPRRGTKLRTFRGLRAGATKNVDRGRFERVTAGTTFE